MKFFCFYLQAYHIIWYLLIRNLITHIAVMAPLVCGVNNLSTVLYDQTIDSSRSSSNNSNNIK